MTNIGIDRITPSGLMTFKSCPKAFYYSYFLGLQMEQLQIHFKFGTAIHLAIDEIFRQVQANEDNLQQILNIFNENFLLEHVDNVPIKDRDTKYLEMTLDGGNMLVEFYQMRFELIKAGVHPIETEIVFKGQLYHPETKKEWPVPMSLRIDGENPDRICEFKTSASKYDEEETRQSLQAKSYVFTRFLQTGIIKPIDYVVLIKKRKKNKIQHFTITYSYEEMLGYQEEVESIFKKIINREFDANPNHPYYCDCKKFDEVLN